jgi:hypothetical protein
VASESFDNVFTSTYENYRILARVIGSTNLNVTFRFRAAGSNFSSANYDFAQQSIDIAGTQNNVGTSQTSFNTPLFHRNWHSRCYEFDVIFSKFAVRHVITGSGFGTRTNFLM